MRGEMFFGFDVDEQRELYANQSEVKIIKHDPPLSFSEAEMRKFGFSPISSKKENKYRPSGKKANSAKPVIIRNQKYHSVAAASRGTGIPVYLIRKFSKGEIDEKELFKRNEKRLQREEANKAYRESEGI